jgi:hypothetical protein
MGYRMLLTDDYPQNRVPAGRSPPVVKVRSGFGPSRSRALAGTSSRTSSLHLLGLLFLRLTAIRIVVSRRSGIASRRFRLHRKRLALARDRDRRASGDPCGSMALAREGTRWISKAPLHTERSGGLSEVPAGRAARRAAFPRAV